MRKLLLSLLTIGLVAGVAYFGTIAYFSDTEESVENTIQAGTIDIAVDDTNPWLRDTPYALDNMMPGGHEEEISFVITNVGTNPANVWKKVTVTGEEDTGLVSEPECTDQGGVWTNPAGPCEWGEATDLNNITDFIDYSMTVDAVALIDPAWGVQIGDVDGVWILLKTLQPAESMTVAQTYKLDATAGNEYQGDRALFDITLYAEQYMGPGPSADGAKGLVLENKTGDPHWNPIIDGTWGLLTWDDSGNYTLKAWGLNGALTYRIAYWDGSSETGVSGYAAPSAGYLTQTGTYAGFNTNLDAKYWLRPNDWSQANTLWESNLIN